MKPKRMQLFEEDIRCPVCDNPYLEEVPSVEYNTFRCPNPECGAIFKIWGNDEEYEEHMLSLTDEDEEMRA